MESDGSIAVSVDILLPNVVSGLVMAIAGGTGGR
jgi:hypothetical protein